MDLNQTIQSANYLEKFLPKSIWKDISKYVKISQSSKVPIEILHAKEKILDFSTMGMYKKWAKPGYSDSFNLLLNRITKQLFEWNHDPVAATQLSQLIPITVMDTIMTPSMSLEIYLNNGYARFCLNSIQFCLKIYKELKIAFPSISFEIADVSKTAMFDAVVLLRCKTDEKDHHIKEILNAKLISNRDKESNIPFKLKYFALLTITQNEERLIIKAKSEKEIDLKEDKLAQKIYEKFQKKIETYIGPHNITKIEQKGKMITFEVTFQSKELAKKVTKEIFSKESILSHVDAYEPLQVDVETSHPNLYEKMASQLALVQKNLGLRRNPEIKTWIKENFTELLNTVESAEALRVEVSGPQLSEQSCMGFFRKEKTPEEKAQKEKEKNEKAIQKELKEKEKRDKKLRLKEEKQKKKDDEEERKNLESERKKKEKQKKAIEKNRKDRENFKTKRKLELLLAEVRKRAQTNSSKTAEIERMSSKLDSVLNEAQSQSIKHVQFPQTKHKYYFLRMTKVHVDKNNLKEDFTSRLSAELSCAVKVVRCEKSSRFMQVFYILQIEVGIDSQIEEVLAFHKKPILMTLLRFNLTSKGDLNSHTVTPEEEQRKIKELKRPLCLADSLSAALNWGKPPKVANDIWLSLQRHHLFSLPALKKAHEAFEDDIHSVEKLSRKCMLDYIDFESFARDPIKNGNFQQCVVSFLIQNIENGRIDQNIPLLTILKEAPEDCLYQPERTDQDAVKAFCDSIKKNPLVSKDETMSGSVEPKSASSTCCFYVMNVALFLISILLPLLLVCIGIRAQKKLFCFLGLALMTFLMFLRCLFVCVTQKDTGPFDPEDIFGEGENIYFTRHGMKKKKKEFWQSILRSIILNMALVTGIGVLVLILAEHINAVELLNNLY